MRILFVNNIPFNPAYGGIERVTDVLTKALIKRGHQVFYLCSYIHEHENSVLEYDFPAMLFMLPSPSGFLVKENIIFYKELLKKQSIDIVVNQRGLSSEFNETLLHGTKCISVLHAMPNCSILAECQNILSEPSNFIESLKYPLKVLLYPFLSCRIKRIMRKELSEHFSYITEKSEAIVLLSDNYKKEFLSYLPKYHAKIIRGIPNPNSFPLQQIDLKAKEKIILYVGRLDKYEKCPLRLLKIWRKLFLKHSDWKLMIVGDGAERLAMQSYIEKNGLERVCLLGRKRNLEDYYRRASIVCLTSTYEGWGMALTEGMQFGCIPFTFNYGSSSDIVDNGVNGYLIRAYNLRAFARRLSVLMSDVEKQQRMAMSSYHHSKKFDVENIVSQWEKLFCEILKSKLT